MAQELCDNLDDIQRQGIHIEYYNNKLLINHLEYLYHKAQCNLIALFTVKQIVPPWNSSFIVKDTNGIEIMVETIEPHFFRCSVCKSNEYKCIHGAAVGVYVITYMENEYKEYFEEKEISI